MILESLATFAPRKRRLPIVCFQTFGKRRITRILTGIRDYKGRTKKTGLMRKLMRLSLGVLFAVFALAGYAAPPYVSLSFPEDNMANNEVSTYNEEWTATHGNAAWNINGFNNNRWRNWGYIKCGSRRYAFTASIATAKPIDKAIGAVVVSLDKIEPEFINAAYLEVAFDKKFKKIADRVDANTEKLAAGDLTFNIKNAQPNCFYRIVFDCKQGDEKSGNGFVQISKVKYYEAGAEPVYADISNTPDMAYSVSLAHDLIEYGEGLAKPVYVKGIVCKVDTTGFSKYKDVTLHISDDGTEAGTKIVAFANYYVGNVRYTSPDQIKVGDEVVLYGRLTKYGKYYEMAKGNYIYRKK